ncbi:hypothetical protein [Pararhizobium qamdonense]|uniref:hypothetical protein n=1 Tax=Pararhizobium qamdonense TaxID=3031126 RepID=UPI0023E18433|nr:hypothetical protein [Pararhizobium qamdonense]
MISRVSLAAGGILGLIIGLLLYHLINIAVWRPVAVNEGREIERGAILRQAMKNIEQRGKTNAEIRVLDTGALCRELGGHWVPADNVCE